MVRLAGLAGRRGLLVAGLVALFLGGAGLWLATSWRSPSEVSSPPSPAKPVRPAPEPAPSLLLPGLLAALTGTTPAYVSPGGAKAPAIAPTWHGSKLVLPVIAVYHGELEVRLPTRPDGSTAWIPRAAVHLYRSSYRIVVNLSTRHLLLYRDGKLVLDAPAGVGTSVDPTPTGDFFVALFAPAPGPAWGPFVIVTSAHSKAISNWEDSGDAMIAIHGPLGASAEIGTTGARVSHGCVRLHDSALAQLRDVPDGSPIDIIAGTASHPSPLLARARRQLAAASETSS